MAGANSNPLESAHGEKRTLVFAKLGVQFFVVMIVVTVSEHGPDTSDTIIVKLAVRFVIWCEKGVQVEEARLKFQHH